MVFVDILGEEFEFSEVLDDEEVEGFVVLPNFLGGIVDGVLDEFGEDQLLIVEDVVNAHVHHRLLEQVVVGGVVDVRD
jgi:hypothetical protein